MTTAEIQKLCNPFGPIEHIYFYQGTGYAYVEFKDHTSANQAVENLHGMNFKERVLMAKIVS
jgi:RNA recognition motif-containing protein